MTARRTLLQRPARQRGVAIVTALLLTTLAVTIVASLFWQQQVQVRSIENQRMHLQTRWILRGALDWAKLILQQDDRDSQITAETSVWATALAETRLDDYIERERNDNERYDATLSGRIHDAQSRYNLGNLARDRDVSQNQLKVFQRLLEGLRLDAALAKNVAQEVARSQAAKVEAPQGTNPPNPNPKPSTALPMDGREPLPPQRVEDLLAVAGFSQEAVEKLRPFVIVLPPPTDQKDTAINVNMAPPELLAAMVEGLSVSEAANLVMSRKRTPFYTLELFKQNVNRPVNVEFGVKSDYFLVESHIRLGRAALDAEALVRRNPKGANVLWIREN